MFPIRDNLFSRERPLITYVLVGLNVMIYLWDRNWHWLAPGMVFSDLAMRPRDVLDALKGTGDPSALGTLFTEMFLHANLAHIIGNMIFLITFGPNVEHALGGWRFALYYVFWGLVAGASHVFVNPSSALPTVGASGAIGGVLGCYFLLFPGNRITVIIPPFFFNRFVVAAWLLLGVWFLWQIFFPQAGVANWAHAGGFMAGMATVLVAGGRAKILQNARFESDPDADYA